MNSERWPPRPLARWAWQMLGVNWNNEHHKYWVFPSAWSSCSSRPFFLPKAWWIAHGLLFAPSKYTHILNTFVVLFQLRLSKIQRVNTITFHLFVSEIEVASQHHAPTLDAFSLINHGNNLQKLPRRNFPGNYTIIVSSSSLWIVLCVQRLGEKIGNDSIEGNGRRLSPQRFAFINPKHR